MSAPSISDKLVFSASANNVEYVRRLIAEGADVNHVVPDRGSALYVAAHYPVIVTILLEAGADPNHFKTPSGDNVMDSALSWSSAAHSALILFMAGARPNNHTIKTDMSGTIVAPFTVSVGQHVNRMITCGQVAFGNFYGEDKEFEWGFASESGYLVTLDAINGPNKQPLFYIRQESYVFHLIDYGDRERIVKPEDFADLKLDAVFTIHNG